MIHPGIDKVIVLLREAGPEKFDMSTSCETPCCIGGHCALYLDRIRPLKLDLEPEHALAVVANIPAIDADLLCFPTKSSGLCDHVRYFDITLTDAISVLEHYRDTGIVDWSPVSQRLEREAV